MKNVRFAAIGSTLIGLAVVGLCGSVSAATQLQWKLAKGKTYYQRTTADQLITQSIMGQEQKITQGTGIGMKLQVLDVDAKGNMKVQYTYIWTRFKQNNPMAGTVEYDSSQKSAAVPTGAEGFAALIGQSYTMTLTPRGKVLDVNGVDQLKQAVLKKLPTGADDAQTAQMTGIMSPYIDKDSLKQMTESRMDIYPDKPVSPGDSWTKDLNIAVGFAMTIKAKNTLQKEEAGVATIATAATIKTDPSKPMDMGGMSLSFDLSGTQDGAAQVAKATGLISSAKEHQVLKGEIKLGPPAQGQPAMNFPMTMDTQITEEMSDQMWKTDPK